MANLRRTAFGTDDVTLPGSDWLVDDLVVHGVPEAVADGLRAHLGAGANKVAVQVISDDSDILRAARALAPLI